jgi:nucleoside-diphosphate-sugar epimerase
MTILVTGSAGHLGEALMRTLPNAIGLDLKPSPFTTHVGSIADREFVRGCIRSIDAVIHTATLHKPHVGTHSRQEFINTNVTGTLNLLEEADGRPFLFTSTTSVFGRALTPPAGVPAAWVTEEVVPLAKNIYGVTKQAAENLCELFHLRTGMPCLILRTSRFFPEEDDHAETRETYDALNAKVNEFLHRRVDIEDVVSAHLLALEKAQSIGFGRYIISATTPFTPDDLDLLNRDAPAAVRRHFPDYEEVYARRGWSMFPRINRVYVNERARRELGWEPRHDFARVLARVRAGDDPRSELARTIGARGYHAETFAEGPYPV